MAALLQQLCSAAFNQQTFKSQLQNSDKLVEHEGQESQQQQEQERKTCGKWGKIRDGQGNCTTAAAFNYDNQYTHTCWCTSHTDTRIYTV